MDEQADFIAKLVRVEEQAHLLVAEGPSGLARTRAQHIILLVKTLRGRLELGTVSVTATVKGAAGAHAAKKPPA
jgi:hypothetical protein